MFIILVLTGNISILLIIIIQMIYQRHDYDFGVLMNEPDRRSGEDRRYADSLEGSDRRYGGERRSVVSETDRMVEYLKKIPVFKGLTQDQYRRILYICYHKTIPGNLFLFEQGDKSDALFILLSGALKVLYDNSTYVAKIEPVSVVGETGFFSGRKRETAVVTTEESIIIKITKTELSRLMNSDNSLSNRLLLNVIVELSEKMDKYTRIIQDLRKTVDANRI